MASIAMKPPPPGLLLISTGWFQILDSFSETCRNTASGPLPAANAVTMVTGLVGKLLVCAVAGGQTAAKDAAAKTLVASKRGLIDFMVVFYGLRKCLWKCLCKCLCKG